ncbi:MAG TPA: hypothetical protein VM450_16665 [Thermomicrobiales bacterium]|nr:hypothetical protein [Thermomicrobiales bacterium]
MRRAAAHLAAIALGMLLIVLGHDAIMAANPHAAGHGAAHASAPHVVAPDHQDVPCGPTIGIRPQPGDDLDATGHLPALIVADALPLAARPALPITWVDPDHPPDVRRALLQVFLN